MKNNNDISARFKKMTKHILLKSKRSMINNFTINTTLSDWYITNNIFPYYVYI